VCVRGWCSPTATVSKDNTGRNLAKGVLEKYLGMVLSTTFEFTLDEMN
jgi:hypothetical protein